MNKYPTLEWRRRNPGELKKTFWQHLGFFDAQEGMEEEKWNENYVVDDWLGCLKIHGGHCDWWERGNTRAMLTRWLASNEVVECTPSEAKEYVDRLPDSTIQLLADARTAAKSLAAGDRWEQRPDADEVNAFVGTDTQWTDTARVLMELMEEGLGYSLDGYGPDEIKWDDDAIFEMLVACTADWGWWAKGNGPFAPRENLFIRIGEWLGSIKNQDVTRMAEIVSHFSTPLLRRLEAACEKGRETE